MTDKDELVESLLHKICYVIDFLPMRVPEQCGGRFWDVEEYFLQGAEHDRLVERLVRIIIKLQCYHAFEIFCEQWYEDIGMEELAELIKNVLMSRNGYMNILSRDDKMLITVSGSDLHISVYNPPILAVANLSSLASSEGLFLRRADSGM